MEHTWHAACAPSERSGNSNRERETPHWIDCAKFTELFLFFFCGRRHIALTVTYVNSIVVLNSKINEIACINHPFMAMTHTQTATNTGTGGIIKFRKTLFARKYIGHRHRPQINMHDFLWLSILFPLHIILLQTAHIPTMLYFYVSHRQPIFLLFSGCHCSTEYFLISSYVTQCASQLAEAKNSARTCAASVSFLSLVVVGGCLALSFAIYKSIYTLVPYVRPSSRLCRLSPSLILIFQLQCQSNWEQHQDVVKCVCVCVCDVNRTAPAMQLHSHIERGQ